MPCRMGLEFLRRANLALQCSACARSDTQSRQDSREKASPLLLMTETRLSERILRLQRADLEHEQRGTPQKW